MHSAPRLIMGSPSDSETFLDVTNGRLLSVGLSENRERMYPHRFVGRNGRREWSPEADGALVGDHEFFTGML